MDKELIPRIKELLLPLLENMHLQLVELNVFPQRFRVCIKVLTDKPQGGISISECSLINRYLVGKLEQEPLVGEDFEVEVSSPGIDRPLKTKDDFLRVIGREVRFQLIEAVDHKIGYIGVVKEVFEEIVKVQLIQKEKSKKKREGRDQDQKWIDIPISKVQKAIQIILE